MSHAWSPLRRPAHITFPPLKDYPRWVHELARRASRPSPQLGQPVRQRQMRGRPKLSRETIEIIAQEMERVMRDRSLSERSAAGPVSKALKRAHGIDRSEHSIRRIFRERKTEREKADRKAVTPVS